MLSNPLALAFIVSPVKPSTQTDEEDDDSRRSTSTVFGPSGGDTVPVVRRGCSVAVAAVVAS